MKKYNELDIRHVLLWWSFNEFGTIGRGDCLDVISFSRTLNDFTSKLFDGVLFMKYEEFYQDIYNRVSVKETDFVNGRNMLN